MSNRRKNNINKLLIEFDLTLNIFKRQKIYRVKKLTNFLKGVWGVVYLFKDVK